MSDFRVEPYADFGSGEPWVARTILALPELVNAVPAFATSREKFALEAGEVFQTLGKAFNELRNLRRLLEEEAPALDITKSYEDFYGSLWQAYKDRFQTSLTALGFDFGFLYQADANFEKGASALVKERPELRGVVDLMRRCRAKFQNALSYYRNEYLEHRGSQPDPRMLESFHRLESAVDTFDEVWKAMEGIVAGLVVAHLPAGLALAEIPEDQREKEVPKRFRFVLARG